jgi:hypothetical protein
MKLTTEQIDQLYTFTRQHYVEWYDLQSELVDHLANAIESELQENPKSTFDEVLNMEFQKFGVFGFMGVVEEKQKFLGTKYRKLIWSYYKEFFRLPKIILTIALIYGVNTIINFFESPKDIFLGTFFVAIFSAFVLFLIARRNLKQKEKRTGKKWLFEDNSFSVSHPLQFILWANLFNLSISLLKIRHWPNEYLILASCALVFLVIFIFIQYKIIPVKVAEELAKTYPEYSI